LGAQDKIAIRETVALGPFARHDWQRMREHRPGRHAGVKLAVLAARIDPLGQVVEQLRIEFAAGE